MRAAGKSEEEVKEFEKKAAPMAKKIMKEIGEYDVYRGESLDNSAMWVWYSLWSCRCLQTNLQVRNDAVSRWCNSSLRPVLEAWFEGGEGIAGLLVYVALIAEAYQTWGSLERRKCICLYMMASQPSGRENSIFPTRVCTWGQFRYLDQWIYRIRRVSLSK